MGWNMGILWRYRGIVLGGRCVLVIGLKISIQFFDFGGVGQLELQ